jgi:hypothetical protein
MRWFILGLLISTFSAGSAAVTALITSIHSEGAWKLAIFLCGCCIAMVPLASLLLLRRATRTSLARIDGVVAAIISLLVVPLPVLIFDRLVAVVAAISFPELGVRLLTASIVICTLVGISAGWDLTKRCSQPLTGA